MTDMLIILTGLAILHVGIFGLFYILFSRFEGRL